MHRKAGKIEKEVISMRRSSHLSKALKWHLIIVALLFAVFIQTDIHAVTINVVDENGNPINTGFRYLIQEDNSFYTVPGEGTPTADWDSSPTATNPSHTLGVDIHKSHAPVICSGDTGAKNVSSVRTTGCTIQRNKRYLVSVIPWHANPGFPVGTSTPGPPTATPPWFADQPGYTMSGQSFAGSDRSVTVVVHKFPVPTAQITILVFHDNNPINFAYDQPEETGLSGFNILLTDIVGKMMQDAWANPVGTTYQVVRENPPCGGINGYCRPIKNPDGTYQFITDKGVNAPGLPLVDYMGNGTLTSCPSGDPAYDAANCVDLDTGAPLGNGEAVVRFVSPNKCTIEIIPPANDPGWILTGTFEGTRGNDAWVRGAEPRFNIILGQLNWLVPFGFVKNMPMTLPTPNGSGRIKGQVVSVHDMHPPFAPGASPGLPVPFCYVGLNNLSGNDEQVYTAPCGPNGTFDIQNVPLGLYQLVMWDWPINSIIDFRNVTVSSDGQLVDLGPTPMFGWFGTMMGSVFNDTNKNGFRDPGEPGIADVSVNCRFADGSPYATQTTDDGGNYSFTQVFPWWQYLVMELDPGALPGGYGRLKTTGMTAVIDDGGWLNQSDVCVGCANPNPPPDPNPYAVVGINPQKQPDGKLYRTQLSTPNAASPNAPIEEVATQAMTLMADMTNMIDWGKTAYDSANTDGSCPSGLVCNGGIKGFISYATSRTQEDPGRSLAQGWEPGIPRVKVSLHHAVQDPKFPDRWVCATCTDPYDLTTCKANPVDRRTGLPACNKPINITYTDSFDDNNPTGCVSSNAEFWPNPQQVGMNGPLHKIRDCAETLRTWNQIRPGVFDGAYKFSQWCKGRVTASYDTDPVNAPKGAEVKCSGGTWVQNVPPGNYIVEADPPKGYEILKWGDRNIEFGEPDYPFQALQPPCEGPDYDVPAFHTLFPDWQIQTAYPEPNQWFCDGQQLWSPDGTMNPGFNAKVNTKGICASGNGPKAPLCTHRYTSLTNGQSSIVDFRMFTHVPPGARIWGWVSDDLHLESNPNSPNASSNFAPSWLPVSVQDWAGNEVGRFYTDQWGRFNGIVPSTYTIFTPNPLGMSAGIYTIFPNDIGPVDSRTIPQAGTGGKRWSAPKKCDANTPPQSCIIDPWYNPGLGREVIRENWDFYAGKTTFIDTIVIPTTGFVANRIPLNCDYADKTPIIFSVDGPLAGGGPVITGTYNGTPTITIKAINPTGKGRGGHGPGFIEIPNPDYNPSLPVSAANPTYVIRDHGFGNARGTVTIGGTALNITTWSQGIITATLPTDKNTGLITVPVGDYQLVVTRKETLSPGGGPISSVVGVTFHVVGPNDTVIWVAAPPADPTTGIPTCNPNSDKTFCMRIQPAIDLAPATGGLIIVGPGNYMENPIMYKPVKLQGVGGGTILDNTYAIGNLPMKNYWQNVLFPSLTANGWISTPPGALTDFTFEQGAGIFVSSCDYTTPGSCPNFNQFTAQAKPMIDGMTITEASEAGGGIYVNAYSPYLQISNCEI
ncbi:MAG TPA: SdrD B-like domain-containing protein, partial [Thermodesulfobacteriota bacterium]|nr:SdrD B-like domain-containing protein [Thermodesulfobacteriota bacterium]